MNDAAVAGAGTRHDLVRGYLAEAGDDRVVLTFPGTDYRTELKVTSRPTTEVGKRILGVIQGQARRIDVCGTGGKYVEPVYGRPKRVQGKIVAVDLTAGTVTVDAGAMSVVVKTDPSQDTGDFAEGDFVTFAVLPGATFTPEG